MSKLTHITFVKNEGHCIKTMLESILPYVDSSYILIDDTTTDNTKDVADKMGCHTKYFRFDNFGKSWNTLLEWVSDIGGWLFSIAPDETIDPEFGSTLHDLVVSINNTDIDVVGFPRRHWEDLDKNVEYTKQNWYPDYQYRLLRNDYPRIHLVNLVHEWIVGDRKRTIVSNHDIHHFNMVYKRLIDYDFDKMNQLYSRLANEQLTTGGKDIWPDGWNTD